MTPEGWYDEMPPAPARWPAELRLKVTARVYAGGHELTNAQWAAPPVPITVAPGWDYRIVMAPLSAPDGPWGMCVRLDQFAQTVEGYWHMRMRLNTLNGTPIGRDREEKHPFLPMPSWGPILSPFGSMGDVGIVVSVKLQALHSLVKEQRYAPTPPPTQHPDELLAMQCRRMETRTCPPSLGACGEVCARFESDDPTPWRGVGSRP